MRKIYTVSGKIIGIVYCVFKRHTTLPVIQFSQRDMAICASIVPYIL
jgi:hypothetical protein